MLFDGTVDLPTATLRPSASEARHRVIAGHFYRWLALRWSWLRPRTVPIIVAFFGMLAILGATKYLSAYARGDLMLDAPVQRTSVPANGFAVGEPSWSSPAEPQVQPPAAGGRLCLPAHRLTTAASGTARPVEITLDGQPPRR
jgi:hypothetical protein